MKIAVLGTGIVGIVLATKLVELGNHVKMGSREKNNKKAAEWAAKAGANASIGTFEDAAGFGDMIILSVKGDVAIDVIKAAKHANLRGKTIVDTCNPLDFSTGVLKLSVCNTDSLAERIQKEVPEANVVNTLNTVGAVLMTNPGQLDANLSIFVCGNNENAKLEVTDMLKKFGWSDIIDLGDITGARGTEMALPLWIRMFSKWNDPYTSIKIIRKKQ